MAHAQPAAEPLALPSRDGARPAPPSYGDAMRHRVWLCTAVWTLVAISTTAGPAAAAEDPAWAQRALGLQYDLAGDVALRNTPWIYTHNSYNSVAEMGPTLSNQDSNQHLDLVTQLDIGVRSLEIDTHLFPSPRDPRVGLLGPVVCHATGPGAGCSAEKPLVEVLGEIRGWLDRNPGQVILLYLESHLRDEEGYAAGTDSIEETLGDLVYRPSSGGASCDELPLELTRDQVRAAGKQVVAMGPCGDGTRWQSYVHDEEPRKTGSDNAPFEAFPSCGPDFDRDAYDRLVIRYYEDATQLTRTAGGGSDPIGPELAARMSHCGVDLIGLDFLETDDPRLAAQVWSWAPGEPGRRGSCSVQLPNGRWVVRPCSQRHRVACRTASGEWVVPKPHVRARSAPRACGRPGLVHAVPRTGYEGALLRAAMGDAGARGAWLGQRRRGDGWELVEKAGCGPSLVRPKRRWPVRRGVASFVVRLRFDCTGERLGRRVRVHGARSPKRARTGRRISVRVRRGVGRLRVSYGYRGKRRSVRILLRRGSR